MQFTNRVDERVFRQKPPGARLGPCTRTRCVRTERLPPGCTLYRYCSRWREGDETALRVSSGPFLPSRYDRFHTRNLVRLIHTITTILSGLQVLALSFWETRAQFTLQILP